MANTTRDRIAVQHLREARVHLNNARREFGNDHPAWDEIGAVTSAVCEAERTIENWGRVR